jgi:LAO/AO transport system kinase
MVRDTVLDRVMSSHGVKAIRADVERRVREGELTPTLAAEELLRAAD